MRTVDTLFLFHCVTSRDSFCEQRQNITRVTAMAVATVSLLAQLAVQLARLPGGSVGVYTANTGALDKD